MSQKYDGMSGQYKSEVHWSQGLPPCARRAGPGKDFCVSRGTPWNRVAHIRSCMAETSVLYNQLHHYTFIQWLNYIMLVLGQAEAVPKGKSDRVLHALIQSMNECVNVQLVVHYTSLGHTRTRVRHRKRQPTPSNVHMGAGFMTNAPYFGIS